MAGGEFRFGTASIYMVVWVPTRLGSTSHERAITWLRFSMVSSDFSQTPPICSNGKTEARFSGCDLVGVEHADGGDRRGGQGDRGDVGQGDGAREVNTAGETDAAGTDLGDTAVRAPICRAVPAKSSLVDDRPSDRSMPTPAHPRGQVMGHSLMDPKK